MHMVRVMIFIVSDRQNSFAQLHFSLRTVLSVGSHARIIISFRSKFVLHMVRVMILVASDRQNSFAQLHFRLLRNVQNMLSVGSHAREVFCSRFSLLFIHLYESCFG